MSAPSPAATAPGHQPVGFEKIKERLKPYLVPYYLTYAALLGLITVIFLVVVALMALVATNFNLLGWME